MTWDRFSYLCRKASADCQSGESIAACVTRIEKEATSNLYGRKIQANSWHRKLLDEIAAIPDPGTAKHVIETYGNLKISRHIDEPMQFKRVTAYLAYITVVFFVVAGIYQIKVAPAFLEAFENFDISLPSHLVFYADYSIYFFVVISGLLVLSLVVGGQLANLYQLPYRIEEGFTMRHMVFNSTKASYSNLIEILRFPVVSAGGVQTKTDSLITHHLSTVKQSNMCLVTEMQALLDMEMRALLEGCERQMKYISVAIVVIVLAAIFFFLVSAYSPLFFLGETV